jgi:hypothetical protein
MLRATLRAAFASGCAFILWAGLLATPAQAQSDYENQVRFQLGIVKTFAESTGWEQTHDYEIGSLDDGESDSFTGTFREGWEYRIVSFCDEDCSDIDLYLRDGYDNEIDSDVSVNDVPVMECRPSRTGEYSIQVSMYECSTEPCYFGIGVFGRPRR